MKVKYPVTVITLPRQLWVGRRDNKDPAIVALSVILIVIVILIVTVKSAIELLLVRNRLQADR